MTSYLLTNPTPLKWDHSYSILSGDLKPNEPSPDYMQRFNEIICDFLREQGVPGAALQISLQGKPIYSQGYGISRAGESVLSSSHFRIASISKVFTAIAVIQLCHDKGVSLRTQVFDKVLKGNYIVNTNRTLPKKTLKKITIQDLLRHSAGWDRDISGDQVFWYQQEQHKHLNVWDNEELVKYILTKPLDFKPGERHAYSNLGYLILGIVIEELSGMNYEDYVKNLLRKIGIEDVYIGNTNQQVVDYQEVRYYNNKDPLVEPSVLPHQGDVVPQYGSFPMENTGAYGGWVTCAQNLVTLLDSLACAPGVPKILSDELVQLMFVKPRFAESSSWYGLGLDIEDDGLSFGHTGAMEGTSTTVHHNENNLTWSLLLNSWSKDMDLDGLIKYALSTINGLPLWHGPDIKCDAGEYFVMSEDKLECVRILLPHSRVLSHIIEMKRQGYMIVQINALSLSDDVKFSIIWKKQFPNKNWSIIMDVEIDQFEDCLKRMKEGWLLTSLEAYKLPQYTDICHLFVFEKRTFHTRFVDQKVYALNDLETHKRSAVYYNRSGYDHKTQSIFCVDEVLLVSCIYEKKCEDQKKVTSHTWVDLPIEDYLKRLSETIDNAFHLNYIQFYSTKDVPKVSAVWTKKHYRNMFQRHDVTKYGFLFELRESMRCNRPVLHISAYEHEGVIYFSTMWSTNVRKQSGETVANTSSSVDNVGFNIHQSRCADLRSRSNYETYITEVLPGQSTQSPETCSITTPMDKTNSTAMIKNIQNPPQRKPKSHQSHYRHRRRSRRKEILMNETSSKETDSPVVKIENVETGYISQSSERHVEIVESIAGEPKSNFTAEIEVEPFISERNENELGNLPYVVKMEKVETDCGRCSNLTNLTLDNETEHNEIMECTPSESQYGTFDVHFPDDCDYIVVKNEFYETDYNSDSRVIIKTEPEDMDYNAS